MPSSTRSTEPAPCGVTVRQAIRALLQDEALTALEISERVGVREREVVEHLQHLQRSLGRGRERLAVETSRCIDCGFRFRKRERLTRPGRCPKCGSERVAPPRFSISHA